MFTFSGECPVDRVFEAALKRADELKQELKKLEEFIGTYRQLAVELHIESKNEQGTHTLSTAETSSVDKATQGEAREVETPDAAPPKRVRVSDNPKPAVVVAAAARVIREKGHPMSRRDIHAALSARGIVVRGADEVKALGTMLWRSGVGVLTQLEGYGYWLADEPYPLAGYDPAMKMAAVEKALEGVRQDLGLSAPPRRRDLDL